MKDFEYGEPVESNPPIDVNKCVACGNDLRSPYKKAFEEFERCARNWVTDYEGLDNQDFAEGALFISTLVLYKIQELKKGIKP